jgi:tRNA(Ile)-lysidine synthase
MSQELDLRLIAVHLNHQIRGEESDLDEQYAKSLAETVHVPFVSDQRDVRAIAQACDLSVEEAGRMLRYELFSQVADDIGQEMPRVIIAVAHNKDDQAETVLMRMLRGTGVDGLVGVAPSRDDISDYPIVRPLLSIPRTEIEAYNTAYDLHPRIDSSNSDNNYTRNKIRNELLPYLRKEFNPVVSDALVRLSSLAAQDVDYLYGIADEACRNYATLYAQGVAIDSDDKITIELNALNSYHDAIKSRILMIMFDELGLSRDLSYKHIEAVMKLALSMKTGKRIELPHGYIARIVYNNLELIRNPDLEMVDDEESEHSNQSHFEKDIDACIINIVEYKRRGHELNNRRENSNTYCVDFDKLTSRIGPQIKNMMRIRYREPGDAISLRGMTGKKKISDVFIDMKVPQNVRNKTRILTCKGEVLWIIGFRKSSRFMIDDTTQNVLVIQYSPKM